MTKRQFFYEKIVITLYRNWQSLPEKFMHQQTKITRRVTRYVKSVIRIFTPMSQYSAPLYALKSEKEILTETVAMTRLTSTSAKTPDKTIRPSIRLNMQRNCNPSILDGRESR
nr:unnamed protein product [Callosobruchus analis]